MARELGEEVTIELQTGAAAARGTVHRQGAGRLKHIQVQELWLQQAILQHVLSVKKGSAELITRQTF